MAGGVSSGISVAPWFLSETCRCRDFSLAAMRKYPAQIQSMRCYAQQQGYDLWLLNGSFPRCVACPGSNVTRRWPNGPIPDQVEPHPDSDSGLWSIPSFLSMNTWERFQVNVLKS